MSQCAKERECAPRMMSRDTIFLSNPRKQEIRDATNAAEPEEGDV